MEGWGLLILKGFFIIVLVVIAGWFVLEVLDRLDDPGVIDLGSIYEEIAG